MLRNLLVAALAVATLSSCGSSNSAADSSDRPVIVASTNVWGDVAHQIAGPDADVQSIISSPDQDPHSFEADTHTALKIKRANIVIENGGGYDDFMTNLRKSTGTKAAIVDAVSISGKKPVNGELNEHVWYDFATVQKVAGAITAELASVDKTHAKQYRSRAHAFDAKLAGLIAQTQQLKPRLSGKGIAITEPVPLYLTDALGLVNRTPAAFSEAIEEGEDMAPTVLAQQLALFTQHRVAALVYNEQTTGAITKRVKDTANAADIPVVGVTETLPQGKSYVTWMQDNLDRIKKAVTS